MVLRGLRRRSLPDNPTNTHSRFIDVGPGGGSDGDDSDLAFLNESFPFCLRIGHSDLFLLFLCTFKHFFDRRDESIVQWLGVLVVCLVL